MGAPQAEIADAGRLGARAVGVGRAPQGRTGVKAFFTGMKTLGSRVLDAVTPAGVRVGSKAARADAALGRGLDRAVAALRRGDAEGVAAFRAELLTLRKGERALGRGGIDYDATLQEGLRNRFAAMPERELRSVMSCVLSDTLAEVRSELLDGPPREVLRFNDALVDAGLNEGWTNDEMARPDALRDLSLFESLALDESVRRADTRGSERIDAALEHALGEVGREVAGVQGAVAFLLPTACEAARHAVAELRRDGAIPEEGAHEATVRADAARGFGLVKQRLETMGGETRDMLLRYADSTQLKQLADGTPLADARTPETDAAISAEIPARQTRLTNNLERLVEGLEARAPDAAHADQFVSELRDAVATLRELRGHVATFDLDGARLGALGERLQAYVAAVPAEALALAERTDTEIGSLTVSLRRLGVGHLDEALGGVVAERNAAARGAYSDDFAVFLTSVVNAREGGLPAAMRSLQGGAQNVLDVANALGAGIEGQDHVSPFRAVLLEETVAAYESADLLVALKQMRSAAFGSALQALEDAGMELSYAERTSDLGRELLNHGVFLGMISEQIALELEERGVPVPAEAERVEGGRPSELAQALLRGLGGLQVNNGGRVSFAGSAHEPVSAHDVSLNGSAVRLLDTLARSPFDVADMLEQGFIFNHVLLSTMNQREGVDADQRQHGRELAFQALLANASDAQIANLHDNLNSPEMQTFMGMADVLRFDPAPRADEVMYASARLVASTESFAVLRVLVGEQMTQRALPIGEQAPLEIASREQVPAGYLAAFDQALEHVLKLDTVEEATRDNAVVSESFRTLLSDSYTAPTVGSQRDPAPGGLPGVAGAFSADVGRATMTVTRQGQTVELYERSEQVLPESEKQIRREGAQERLAAFCGGDPALTLGLSRYINQGALASVEAALMMSDMTIPGSELALGMLVREGGRNRFDVHDLGGQRYRIDYSVSWGIKGAQSDTGMVAVDPTQSRLAVRFSATLDMRDPDQPGIEIGDIHHDLHIRRGMRFDVD